MIGYMKIVSSIFVEAFRNKIFNIHPSLLPAFAGGMSDNVHQNVIDFGCKITGATLHIVSEEVDAGKIINQKACDVSKNETVATLKQKVQKLEQEMLNELTSSVLNSSNSALKLRSPFLFLLTKTATTATSKIKNTTPRRFLLFLVFLDISFLHSFHSQVSIELHPE